MKTGKTISWMLTLIVCFSTTCCATLWISESKAATINAASCSREDVQSAITRASSGDTVNVPPGNCTWSSGITIGKQISIIGANTGCPSACDDATTINIGSITPFAATVGNFRISGITFSGSGNSAGVITVNAGGSSRATNWRIDHCHFKGIESRSRGISVGSYASSSGYGADWPALIDHNRFSASASFKAIQHYGGSLTAHGSWDEDLGLGGSNFLFIEDNQFIHSTSTSGVSGIDGDTSARVVIRYNTFANTWISAHGVEVNVGNLWRSSHAWEIYHNNISYTAPSDFCINIRGGTGVIYNNSFTNGPTPIRYFYERGDYDASGRGCYNSADPCDGDGRYDGNQPGRYGYMCYQQIGATGSNGITSAPVYEWGNSRNGIKDESILTMITFSGTCPYQHVQFGRDVILNGTTPKPGYTAFAYPHPVKDGLPVSTPTTPAPNPSPPPSSSPTPPQGLRIIN